MAALTYAEKHAVADELVGTASSGQAIADRYGVSILEVEAAAEECEVKMCANCGWWCETSELNEDDNCEDCRGE